jgi:hypothetical protein
MIFSTDRMISGMDGVISNTDGMISGGDRMISSRHGIFSRYGIRQGWNVIQQRLHDILQKLNDI